MMDFIAFQLSDDEWRQICSIYLSKESEDRIRKENRHSVYDQAYAVIRLLIDKQIVCKWSDMEKILNNIGNKAIGKKFREKFEKKSITPG